jgi:hypothetical protein
LSVMMATRSRITHSNSLVPVSMMVSVMIVPQVGLRHSGMVR